MADERAIDEEQKRKRKKKHINTYTEHLPSEEDVQSQCQLSPFYKESAAGKAERANRGKNVNGSFFPEVGSLLRGLRLIILRLS